MKGLFSSVTVGGIFIAVLPTLLRFFGLDVDAVLAGDPNLLNESGAWFATLVTVIGGGIAIWGRWRAKVPLSLPVVGVKAGMNVMLACVALAVALPMLTACETLAPIVGEERVVSAEDAAYAAASDAFDLWKTTQSIIEKYQALDPCATAPAFTVFCRREDVVEKMKAINRKVSPRIIALRPLLDGKRNDIAWLMAIPALVNPEFAAVAALSKQGK